MASNKDKLKDMVVKPVQQASNTELLQRGSSYRISTQPAEDVNDLSTHYALSPQLQDLAQRYVGARRRSGEALLEAARWLTEAHQVAQHGEWQVFLDATRTSSDTAERFRNIYKLALQNPQFADSLRDGRLSQSAAALLARTSTPSMAIDTVLASATPQTVAEVEQVIRAVRQQQHGIPETQNPQFADFGSNDHLADAEQSDILARLEAIAAALEACLGQAYDAHDERFAHIFARIDRALQHLSVPETE